MWAGILLALTLGVAAVVGLGPDNACVPSKCIILHNCRCALTGPLTPGGLSERRHIPQFVTVTFQGIISKETNINLKRIFEEYRKNDDGCEQKATFFIPGKGNDWKMVKQWYQNGHEIGSYSNSYNTMQQYWQNINRKTMREEASGSKITIQDEAGIPASEIRGWRTPLLEFGGDVMMKALRDTGYEYDSTLKVASTYKIWPFTMDHGWPFDNCRKYTNACIKKPYPRFWEFPVINHEADGEEMATFAKITSDNSDDIVRIMKENFNSYYIGHRSPFMMTFTTSYFFGDLAEVRIKALEEFLSYLEEQEDVYVTTLYDVLKWIRHPKKSADMKGTCKKKIVKSDEKAKIVPFDYNQLTRYQLFAYYYGKRVESASASLRAAVYAPAVLSLCVAMRRFF